ncbi:MULTISPECIES: phosphate ABC transporter substrate-binding protein PstS [unclassified Saccharopolyspora]|uniref:phosphate ABC transporter substrate-binding protein PstS n=1 Tax=unclassified Saccharopolyspora TaxID=2646250 RepID=UPI001CD4BA84|nr:MULTISPECIES: phosphate ABC transporter substrate-binding protein PstS [unclassified Saccharopolyspora]MCA1186459.1 phosphate ABC transporter substrate-binding protein PstS [Saccharopolyspora sp. 6T]MCA1192920.1 phosphate ABC transporter substrate-binding protein PstS [Saccharopolyspora sp. 6V]MCA1226748.1 phosphate ABC transporter substrate-binding protein PstS [Saccharopolyspora sp. 6M]MCA1282745.1 phosphate ABC transporter substrate-binding protein PstS [Saccharopolyspora sp. 7B]
MKIKRHSAALGFFAAGTLVLSACGTDQNVPQGGGNPALAGLNVDCGTKPVSAEGSSAQKNAMDVFARDYGIACEGQQLNYTKSGSGKGVAAFTAGQIDFGGSDSPLDEADGEVAKAAERCQGNPAWNIPMVFGPIAVSYNVEGVDDLVLNADVIAKIYQGQIKNWNDPAVAALNPGKQLPDLAVVPFFRSDESGTSDNFQKYLSTATGGAWKGEGKQFQSGPGIGQGREGSDQVAQSVKATPGAITYVEWSFPKNLGLGIAKIDGGAGPVDLTTENVGKAIDGAKVEGEGHDLRVDLDSIYGNKQPGVYPIVLNTYEIVCSKGYDPETAKAVKAVLTVAANADAAQLEEAGYVSLPEAFKQKVLGAVDAIA